MIKIGCVCGLGMGSGLLVKMAVDNVLKRNGFEDGTWLSEVLDVNTASKQVIDIYLTTREFATKLRDTPAKVVTVINLFNEKEIEEALVPVYKEVVNIKSSK